MLICNNFCCQRCLLLVYLRETEEKRHIRQDKLFLDLFVYLEINLVLIYPCTQWIENKLTLYCPKAYFHCVPPAETLHP